MLPCERHVHLHKSNIFETIFEQIQKYHKREAEMDSEMIEKNI